MSAMEACAVELIRHANDWFRRILVIDPHSGERPLIACFPDLRQATHLAL
jgi:hypothetical protein